MSKTPRHSAGSGVPNYQLKVSLLEVRPAVWRRLLVRGDLSLGLLHAVFQVAIGWTNSHLHHFFIGEERYTEFLKAIRNPRHPEHSEMLQWIGRDFDPQAFDLEKVNRCLLKLKWRRTTVTQLARVLMERDGYRE